MANADILTLAAAQIKQNMLRMLENQLREEFEQSVNKIVQETRNVYVTELKHVLANICFDKVETEVNLMTTEQSIKVRLLINEEEISRLISTKRSNNDGNST